MRRYPASHHGEPMAGLSRATPVDSGSSQVDVLGDIIYRPGDVSDKDASESQRKRLGPKCTR